MVARWKAVPSTVSKQNHCWHCESDIPQWHLLACTGNYTMSTIALFGKQSTIYITIGHMYKVQSKFQIKVINKWRDIELHCYSLQSWISWWIGKLYPSAAFNIRAHAILVCAVWVTLFSKSLLIQCIMSFWSHEILLGI